MADALIFTKVSNDDHVTQKTIYEGQAWTTTSRYTRVYIHSDILHLWFEWTTQQTSSDSTIYVIEKKIKLVDGTKKNWVTTHESNSIDFDVPDGPITLTRNNNDYVGTCCGFLGMRQKSFELSRLEKVTGQEGGRRANNPKGGRWISTGCKIKCGDGKIRVSYKNPARPGQVRVRKMLKDARGASRAVYVAAR